MRNRHLVSVVRVDELEWMFRTVLMGTIYIDLPGYMSSMLGSLTQDASSSEDVVWRTEDMGLFV